MSRKIKNKYFFSAFPLIVGIIFLPFIGLQYLGLTFNPHSLENYELSKQELRLPEKMHPQIIAQKKMTAKIIGFANVLPDPLNSISFATIPLMSFLWLYFLFRKFGKDGIALEITDTHVIVRTYRGPVTLPRDEILEVIAESPSEIEFKTVKGHRYLSTSTVVATNAKLLKSNLDAWKMKEYELIAVSDDEMLNALKKVPDIHNSLMGKRS